MDPLKLQVPPSLVPTSAPSQMIQGRTHNQHPKQPQINNQPQSPENILGQQTTTRQQTKQQVITVKKPTISFTLTHLMTYKIKYGSTILEENKVIRL